MIPKRTLTATLEISTGSMIITNRPPAFTGEADALTVSVSVLDGGAAYTPVGNVLAKLYLYWPGTINMSEAVDLTITGSTLTGSLPDTLTAVPGCPLMVIQLTDTDSGDLIVAAATPIQITNVLGERVISSRPATPSEIIYIGRSPYIDMTTGHWMQWDTASSGYIDTGVTAAGRPATFTAVATTLPAGSAATASITGTPDAPILNLGIPKGQDGQDSAVLSVNGQTGAVQLNDEHIPSNAVSGQTNVEGALGAIVTELSNQSQQIANVQNSLAYIVGNTNTTGSTLASGTFVYVKGHSTIAEGLRKVTSSISANTSITTNNTEDCTGGGLNALNNNLWKIIKGQTTSTTSNVGTIVLGAPSGAVYVSAYTNNTNYWVKYYSPGTFGIINYDNTNVNTESITLYHYWAIPANAAIPTGYTLA